MFGTVLSVRSIDGGVESEAVAPVGTWVLAIFNELTREQQQKVIARVQRAAEEANKR